MVRRKIPVKGPSLHEVRQRIEAIRRIDLESADPGYLRGRIDSLFHGFVNETPFVNPGQKVYRAVKWAEKPSYVHQLSYPPAERVSKYGRVNRPGQPIFYGSIGWNAPLFELRLKPGDQIALSRWAITSKLVVNNIGFTESAFQRLQSDRNAKQSWRRQDQSGSSPSNRLRENYFGAEFTQDVPDHETHKYKISAIIADILLSDIHDDDKIDDTLSLGMAGLLYPAVALLGHSDNLALKPEIVDKYLRIEQVEYIRIDSTEIDGKYVTFHNTHLDFANSFGSDQSIEWKGRPARWHITIPPGGKVQVSKENGRAVYRDEAGNIIDPMDHIYSSRE